VSAAQTWGTPMVTGEAVPLDVRLAQLPSRAMAITVDIAVQLMLIAAAGWLLGLLASHGSDSATVEGLGVALLVLILVGYPLVWETLTGGRSLGKLAVGLRVVRDDGGACHVRQSLVRALFAVVEIWMLAGIPAITSSMLSSRGKRLGDLAAGTVVVRERMPRSRAAARPQLGAALEDWARTADLSAVGDDLALSIRAFLARAGDLRPDARAHLSHQLTSEVLARVAPPPPWGTPQEAILSAVLTERRRRAELRLPAPPTAGPGPRATSPQGFGPPA